MAKFEVGDLVRPTAEELTKYPRDYERYGLLWVVYEVGTYGKTSVIRCKSLATSRVVTTSSRDMEKADG